MPNTKGAVTTLRGSAVRLRRESERLAARIDRDVRAFTKRTRAEITTDVRKLQGTIRSRADDAIREVEKRGARVVAGVEKQVAKTAEEVLKRLHAATQSEVAALMRRVQELETRVATLEGLSEEGSVSV